MNTEKYRFLGFDSWFIEKTKNQLSDDFELGRVISVNKNNYEVYNGESEMIAELSGKFLFSAETATDFPTVGDWVCIQAYNDNTLAIVNEVLPRKSLLKRKSSGVKTDIQMIAANVDTALIVQALDDNFNLRRLERYLVIVRESSISPVILLSKSDVLPQDQIEEKLALVKTIANGAPVIAFSNHLETDIENLTGLFAEGLTYCLLGSSGVGKTTLINRLLNHDYYKTLETRAKDGKGRHTTTRRELIFLRGGAMIIDNPGMRELGVMSVEAGINETFSEIEELALECRFADCTHTVEAGCAVLNALHNGSLLEQRYNNYMKMIKESRFNEMTYVERRQKDKQFGKHVRSILKQKTDKLQR